MYNGDFFFIEGARLQKYWFLLKDLASDQDSALLSIVCYVTIPGA